MLEDRGHGDGVELAAVVRKILRERARDEVVAGTGQLASQGGVDADSLPQRRTERPEQCAVVATDVEHTGPGRDASDDLVDAAVAEVAVEVLHVGGQRQAARRASAAG